jgi:hypothetical protein
MADCDTLLDLRAKIGPLGLRRGVDFAVVYDSTMVRCWFFNDRARELTVACLNPVTGGRIVPESEFARLGTLCPDRYFGELMFLTDKRASIATRSTTATGRRPITSPSYGSTLRHPPRPSSPSTTRKFPAPSSPSATIASSTSSRSKSADPPRGAPPPGPLVSATTTERRSHLNQRPYFPTHQYTSTSGNVISRRRADRLRH